MKELEQNNRPPDYLPEDFEYHAIEYFYNEPMVIVLGWNHGNTLDFLIRTQFITGRITEENTCETSRYHLKVAYYLRELKSAIGFYRLCWREDDEDLQFDDAVLTHLINRNFRPAIDLELLDKIKEKLRSNATDKNSNE